MTRSMKKMFNGFRLPSLSAMIAEVEQSYVNAADNETERRFRKHQVASGYFRGWN